MISSWRSIFTLIIFLLTNLVGVFPFYISIPLPTSLASMAAKLATRFRLCLPSQSYSHGHPSLCKSDAHHQHKKVKWKWHRLPINFQTAPLAAVLLLLATNVLHRTDIKEGIVGSNASGVHPLDIMALFISLAYISISLDATGLFRFLAFWVVRKGGSSGRRLYLYLYLFFFMCATFVGNDPVILSGTPFLAYFSRVSGIVPPTAWIFAQFAVANISSAILPSSNPTNLVLTGAFSYSFISYTAHAILPSIATALAVFPLLVFVLFRSRELVPHEIDVVGLPSSVSVPESESLTTRENEAMHTPGDLTDKNGAIFGSVLLGVTLGTLIGTSPLKIPVYRVTVPPAVIMLARDIWHDRKHWKMAAISRSAHSQQETSTSTSRIELEVIRSENGIRTPSSDTQGPKDHWTLFSCLEKLKTDTLPTAMHVLPRLPVSLVLFAFCMFILVQALTTWGWVEVFAEWWAAWIRVCARNGTASATVGAICGMLLISTLLCNMCGTNIGATILLARVLQTWLASSASSTTIDPKVRLGSIFALALGTNFGAFTFSFSASLAGLLWRDILRQKGIVVRQRQFALLNLPIVGVASTTAAMVLVAEVYVVGQ